MNPEPKISYKRYDEAFKRSAVEHWMVSGKSATQVARVAFTKNIVPVWATTNGVSIGPIPTNCVFYSDIVSNKVVTTVVY